jgi:hypothetical protein
MSPNIILKKKNLCYIYSFFFGIYKSLSPLNSINIGCLYKDYFILNNIHTILRLKNIFNLISKHIVWFHFYMDNSLNHFIKLKNKKIILNKGFNYKSFILSLKKNAILVFLNIKSSSKIINDLKNNNMLIIGFKDYKNLESIFDIELTVPDINNFYPLYFLINFIYKILYL